MTDHDRGRWGPWLSIEDRFWTHVDKSGDCWEWTASRRGKGYGQFYVNRGCRSMDAHRFSATLHFGAFDQRLRVLHHCDNPKCVRPEHLYLGTDNDNMRDMVSRGRAMWGGRCKRGHDLAVTGVPCNKGKDRRCAICWEESRHVSA